MRSPIDAIGIVLGSAIFGWILANIYLLATVTR